MGSPPGHLPTTGVVCAPQRHLPTAGVCDQCIGALFRLLPTACECDQCLGSFLKACPTASFPDDQEIHPEIDWEKGIIMLFGEFLPLL